MISEGNANSSMNHKKDPMQEIKSAMKTKLHGTIIK